MSQIEIERRHGEAEAHVCATMMNELCEVIQRTNLSPMAVLRLTARSIGTTYREIAEAHAGSDPCPSGWCPQEAPDVEVMGMALIRHAGAIVCAIWR